MGALNSFALWGSLAAVGIAVPIIIHLLYRKQRKQTDWAAMELLRRALVIRSGQVKLEDFLILFLRCLALALIAFALLRPTLTSDTGGGTSAGMVVAIDASYSMNHGEHSRFEKAVAAARRILDEAREGDPVTIMLMSSRPEVLLRGARYQPGEVSDLLDTLDSASPYRLGLDQNIELFAELISEFKTAGKECYLITDGQELDWGALSDSAKAAMQRLTSEASFLVVPVNADGDDNLSLVDLKYSAGSLRKSGVARFTARVRNTGSRVSTAGTVEFLVEGELSKRRSVGALDPGETRDIDFFASFEQPGNVRLAAQLSKDDLSTDNVRHAVANVRSGINVLCVEGAQPASAPTTSRSGAYYAVKALRLKNRGGEGGINVNQVEAADLGLENFAEYDVILLAGVPDVAPETSDRLRKFVGRGGGLIMFAGEGVDPEQYNERFGFDEENGLLPAKLGESVVADENANEFGWSLGEVTSTHSLAGIVARLPSEMLDSARFTKVLKTEPAPQSETILTVAEGDTPLLLSRNIGSGSVLLFTSSADRSWNELAVHPLYAMLLQQAATHLTSHPDALQLTVGEATELAVPGREVGDNAVLNDPVGGSTTVRLSGTSDGAVCPIDPDRIGTY